VRGIVLERLPIAVKGDDPGPVGRHGLADKFFDGEGNDLQDATLFEDGDALERLNVVGVNGEQRGVVVHPLGHVAIKFGERGQILADGRELLRGFVQQAMRDDEFDIGGGNLDLLKTVFDAAMASAT
jgi:hypothetical protein